MPLGSTVEINKQGNVKLLHNLENLESEMDLNKHTHVVKQKSTKWFEL